ncbi:MAG: hypothetical protein ACFBSG_09270 [Leptolyngbyaceae cyanobacterium]
MLSESTTQATSTPTRALLLTKFALAILILGICVVGKRESTWPITTWALYSGYSARFRIPEPTVSEIQLQVLTADGNAHLVKPELILSLPYDSLAHSVVEQAFLGEDPRVKTASQRYLAKEIGKIEAIQAEIDEIQAWKITYQTYPLQIPPIHKDNPQSRDMIGSF